MKLFKLIFVFPFIPGVVAHAGSLDADSAKTIIAPKIEYNVKQESIKTTGKTEISTTSGQRITLVDSYISKTGDDAAGRDIELFLAPNIRVTADTIVRKDGDSISTGAVFTACHGCDSYGNAWEISTTKLVHDINEHVIKFSNPIFWIYDIPVAWFPFLEIPDPTVKYKSGLLTPDFNSTNNMGTQFNFPIYINFSSMHDMTFTPAYLTQENPLFQLEHRLNASHSEMRTVGSFTHNLAGENRWHIFNDDIIEIGENARATIFLERSSDKTYLQKYIFYNDQPYLDSGARLELFGKSGYAVADAHVFQELRSVYGMHSAPSGNILPNVRGVYQTESLFNETYAIFNADILGISGAGTANQRIIGESKIVSPWTLWGGNRVTASASARYDVYNFTNTQMMDSVTPYTGVKQRFLPSGYIEWGLPLIKPEKEWTHVLEPRARLTLMQQTDDVVFMKSNDSAGALLSDATLFSNNRFPGLDLWENGTFADYGMRWAAFNNSGQNLEVFLGQTYDFTNREFIDPNSGFHNGQSDYVGRIGYKNPRFGELTSRFRFDQENLSLRHLENAAHIGSARNYVSLGHIWATQLIDTKTIGDTINEIFAGGAIQLSERFDLKFEAVYNITENKFQRHNGGIYYNHPCYFLSFGYHHDNAVKEDYVGMTTFQFRFGIKLEEVKRYTPGEAQ